MNKPIQFLSFLTLAAVIMISSACAQLSVPSDGSDGALNITSNTVIDLSKALTKTWSDPSSGNGIYDSNQWAVVFKYGSVNITTGAMVTFTNHYANPPDN
jgi:hypothetical protein